MLPAKCHVSGLFLYFPIARVGPPRPSGARPGSVPRAEIRRLSRMSERCLRRARQKAGSCSLMRSDTSRSLKAQQATGNVLDGCGGGKGTQGVCPGCPGCPGTAVALRGAARGCLGCCRLTHGSWSCRFPLSTGMSPLKPRGLWYCGLAGNKDGGRGDAPRRQGFSRGICRRQRRASGIWVACTRCGALVPAAPPPWPFGITALGSRGSGAARQREKGGASCERRQAGGYFYPPPKPAALTNGVMKY